MNDCPTCKREWTGLSEAHCPSCCAHFTSDAAFDRHLGPLDSEPDCHDPTTLTVKNGARKGEPLFEQIERSHGPVWRIADPRQHYLRRDEAEISAPNEPVAV